jgi:alpha-glucosidase (family GH31 glycosyl hydrolase)
MTINHFFVPSRQAAQANPEAVFSFPTVRFTLLTNHFIRIEHSPTGRFEDRPSQAFWYRNQPLPQAVIHYTRQELTIETDRFKLHYLNTPKGITPDSFHILLKSSAKTIHLDDPNPGLLPGTTRTLDLTNGPAPLQPGFLSRDGWTLIDDTPSLLFTAQGWLETRPQQDGYQDNYLLVYGHDYKNALVDYQRISGTPPLLPRAFLGNWWSRYWEYSQEEITTLVQCFQQKQIPLSVFIIDMDWHITKTGNACSGWTGFSWNRELFSNPSGLMEWLHQHSLNTALNLHPAEGIHPHEEHYPQAAQALGLNPEDQNPIPFNIPDPAFASTYFNEMLHPLEEDGVDFWWLDWQQGKRSKLHGLDPLWWLNHLHFFDLGRKTTKRPIIFSRWGGAGNQRYPIGFSGDTVVSWKSLAFQPCFTVSAANAAYGWWSHDIGGHMHGLEDPDLYLRWVQFGVLSPIFRLHCAKDTFANHAPWVFGPQVEAYGRQAMQFRHALVPYLYAMAKRNQQDGLPLITPLYYDWPEEEAAYLANSQYLFGSQLMAAPVTTPLLPEVAHSRQAVWFPKGSWFNFFTGECHPGSQWKIYYSAQEEMPLFAKAGAIIPLQAEITSNGCPNPASMDVVAFPAKDGCFDLYEDDGKTQDYLTKGGCITSFQSHWKTTCMDVEISPSSGDIHHIPAQRTYRILFRGVNQPQQTRVSLDGKAIAAQTTYDEETLTAIVGPVDKAINQQLSVEIFTDGPTLLSPLPTLEGTLRRFLRRSLIMTDTKHLVMDRLAELQKDPHGLAAKDLKLSSAQRMALIELVSGCAAINLYTPTKEAKVLLLNPQKVPGFECRGSAAISISPHGTVVPKEKSGLLIDYFGVVKKKL